MATAPNKIEAPATSPITRNQLYVALEEALKFSNLYIEQLNCYDGANRETYTPGTWILKMREAGKIK